MYMYVHTCVVHIYIMYVCVHTLYGTCMYYMYTYMCVCIIYKLVEQIQTYVHVSW